MFCGTCLHASHSKTVDAHHDSAQMVPMLRKQTGANLQERKKENLRDESELIVN
jgi:hypothetical protein